MKISYEQLDKAEAALLKEWRHHLQAERMYRHCRYEDSLWRQHRLVLATAIRSIRATRDWHRTFDLNDSAEGESK